MTDFLSQRFMQKASSALFRTVTGTRRKATDVISDQHQEYAKLSAMAYQDNNFFKKNFLRNHGLDDKYKINEKLTTNNHTVMNRNDGKVVVALRGTANKDDLVTDMFLALGQENMTGRFKETDDLISSLVNQHGKDNVILTGHSLGASLAEFGALKHDLESIQFNMGSSVTHVKDVFGSQIGQKKDRTNTITHITSGSDPISLLGTVGLKDNYEVIKAPIDAFGSTHSIDYFYEDYKK